MPGPYDFSSLDQETLKAEIIAYIKEDATFADYNFDGSALNSIANLLTYTTLQQNFYLNMTTQELYLDTATLYRNAVAIAKSLNYIPYRMTPAKLLTNVQFLLSTENTEIPQHCKFLVDDIPFTTKTAFNFVDDEILPIELWQMEIVTESYNFDSVPFELLNGTTIADDYIIVKVDGIPWTEYNSAGPSIDATSEVFFLSFNNNERLTVTFGDGIFGKIPTPGVLIEVIYGVTLGVGGNGFTEIVVDQVVSSFEMAYSNVIGNDGKSYGGTAPESLASIKINAPKFYEAQNRALTKSDYKVFIEGHAPSDVKLVNVWDGAEASPPLYGTVFATVKPNSSLNLTTQQKSDLLAYLSQYTVMSIRTALVDAIYVYIKLDSTVYYYRNYGVSTPAIRATIVDNVQNYFDNELTSFNTKLKYSNLVQAIDLPVEVSNNLTEISYYLKFDEAPNSQYKFDVQNAITPGTLLSDNDGGAVPDANLIYDDAGIIKRVSDDAIAGTVDYATGVINFNMTMLASDNVLYFKTDSDDFIFEASNLPYYDGITVTFEGI